MNLKSKLPFFIQQAKKSEAKEPIWLEYLESDGNQYIDTGVVINTNNYRKEIVLSNVAEGTNSNLPVINGSQNVTDSNKRSPYIGLTPVGKLAVGYATQGASGSSYRFSNPTTATLFVLERKPTGFMFTDGTDTYNWEYSGSHDLTNLSEWLFAGNFNQVNNYNASGRIYGYRLYIDDVLVRDMRPCLHPTTRRPAMYDMVGKKYYYNQGASEFKYEESFIKLDYIETDQSSYINTGYLPDINVTEFDFEFMNYPQTQSLSGLIGSRQGYGSYSYNFFYTNSQVIQIDWDYTTLTRVNAPCANNEKHILSVKISEDGTKSYTYLDGVQVKESNASNHYKSKYAFWVGQFNNAGTGYNYGAPIRIYSLKIYDNKMLARDYIPVRMNDGQFGLYDFITGMFYGNAGKSGAFKGYIGDMQVGEYLESDSTAYIDTGVAGDNDGLAINVTFLAQKLYTNGHIYGNFFASGAHNSTRLMIYSNVEYFANLNNTNDAYVSALSDKTIGVKHTIYQDFDKIVVDGAEVVKTNKTKSTANNTNLALFNRSVSNPITRDLGLRIFSCQIYYSGAIIAKMIPAKLSDGRIGMWDLVRNKLYENQGTGEFIFG